MKLVKQSLGKVSITVEKNYWNNSRYYDRLVIVEHKQRKRTYISRKPVPAGTNIDDREYWIPFCTLPEEFVGTWNTMEDHYNRLNEAVNNAFDQLDNKIVQRYNYLYQQHVALAGRVTNIENSGSHISPTGEVERPTLTPSDAGYQHFDVNLGIPIWWTGTIWVDAVGHDVTNYSE